MKYETCKKKTENWTRHCVSKVRPMVLKLLTMKSTILWEATPCDSLGDLHVACFVLLSCFLYISTWKWRQFLQNVGQLLSNYSMLRISWMIRELSSPNWLHGVESFEKPPVLWNPEVHYLFHKIPPLVRTLNQISQVNTTLRNFSNIHFITIILSTSKYCLFHLSFWLSHQNPLCIAVLPRLATCLAHVILFDLISVIILSKRHKTYRPCFCSVLQHHM
jgi:hypothetical protein